MTVTLYGSSESRPPIPAQSATKRNNVMWLWRGQGGKPPAILPCTADGPLMAGPYLGSDTRNPTLEELMPTRPEAALLDFQVATTPLVYLADMLYADLDAPEEVRALCAAVVQVRERAQHALQEAVMWAVAQNPFSLVKD